MEEVKECKYLGTALCKHEGMEGEIRERAVKGRYVTGSLARVMKGTNVSIEEKRGLRNSIFPSTLKYGSEIWAQQSGVRAAEMSYLRGVRGVTKWKDEKNQSVYEKCGMRPCANGVKRGVVE